MGTLLISLLTLLLLLISAFVVLVVLMQRTSQNGGMGAALGGGAAESAFGSDTNNVLTKATIYGIISFFVVALGLYLLYQAQAADRSAASLDASALILGEESAEAEALTLPAADVVESEAEGTEVTPVVSEEAAAVSNPSEGEAAPAASDAK